MVSFLTELLSSYGGFGRLPTTSNCANDTEVIDNMLKEGYNKHYIPAYPTRVRVDMWVQEVTAVSELTQDFEIGKACLNLKKALFSILKMFTSQFFEKYRARNKFLAY